jgi:ribonucleoside-triphosphate reductase
MYNCSFLPIDSWHSFSELLFILMCGTGVGFSVEKENVSKLPVIKPPTGSMRDDYVVEDTREGWALALLFAMETWANGEDVIFNFDKIRPYGAPLKMMGGRASGPGPFKELIKKTKEIMCGAKGRQMTSLECHDICCHVAQSAIMGGKRRSAMISFSDVDDIAMRQAKDFTRGPVPTHRYMANNTAVFRTKPTSAVFMQEFAALALSGSGERGILNVSNLKKFCPERDLKGTERTNPCGEILLRPYEFCNLSEAVVRSTDDISDLVEKVKTAAWLGVIQSTYTHFPFLRTRWARNCNEERLIGVSLTGQLDNPSILSAEVLDQLRKVVERTAKHAATKLGINVPAAYTCVKPSGTVSQVVDASPGVHPRWSRYYIRRYRIAKTDPLFKLMVDQGMPFNPEVGQTKNNFTTAVFEFPVESPKTSVFRSDWGAMKQLEWYQKVQLNWSTHNVSNTVYVKPDEWLKVGSWVYDNWDDVVGISFFPFDGSSYELAPYEDITEEKYRQLVKVFPKLDFTKLGEYERQTGDTTTVAQELACSGDKCDIR